MLPPFLSSAAASGRQIEKDPGNLFWPTFFEANVDDYEAKGLLKRPTSKRSGKKGNYVDMAKKATMTKALMIAVP